MRRVEKIPPNIEYRRKRNLHDSGGGVRPSRFKGPPPSGFTLLEVLVALSLLGIAIIAVMQLFSLDLRAISSSEDYVAGVLEAQSKMQEVLSDEEMSERSWRGVTDNGYPFEVSISKSLPERVEELQVRVFEIAVTVFWMKGARQKSMRLTTQKTVQKQV